MAAAARAAVVVGLRGVQLRSFGAVASACRQAQARVCRPQLPVQLQACHFATAAPLRAEAAEAAGEAVEDTDGEAVYYVKTTGSGAGGAVSAAAAVAGPRQAWVYEMFDEEAPLFRSGIVELSEYVFGAKPRLDIMHRVVVWQRREWWQGTSRTKSRGEVRGGGRKPWRQKGTGRARVSSIRSPLWRGGGVIHGPKPRDNSIKLPKKVHYMALRTALSVKLAQGDLVIVEDFEAPTHKTKDMIRIMNDTQLAPSVLFCDGAAVPEKFAKAVQNIPKCAAINVSELSVYEMLLRHRLVLTRGAVELLEELLGHGVFRGTFDPVNVAAAPEQEQDGAKGEAAATA